MAVIAQAVVYDAWMRRILALGCGALYLTFGLTAGLAHVHESADHHDGARGLHLDHGHLDRSADRAHRHDQEHENDHGHGHGHETVDDHEERFGVRHADHHDGDAVHLDALATRTVESNASSMPAIVTTGTIVITPSLSPGRNEALDKQPRDPPRKIPPRLRAPPA